MAGALNSLCHATLEFQRSAGDAAGKDFALFVEELLEEFGILVVDVLDAATLETAVFFLFYVHAHGREVAYFGLSLCHGLVLLCFCGGNFGFLSLEAAALGGVFGSVLVLTESEETEHALVAAVSCFEFLDYFCSGFKLEEAIEAGGLLLDGVGEFAQAPFFGVHNLRTVVGEHFAELFYRFLHLNVRQNGS